VKTLLIIGIVLLAGGILASSTKSNTSNPNQVDAKGKIVSASILTGFALMVISGIMYLNK